MPHPRRILPTEFVACDEAFVDRRNANSAGKQNYCFIGPGVTQSDSQFVNIAEAHGFQVGGVTLPRGHINNLHLHFTAEVLITAGGEWECIWGNAGESRARIGALDIFTVPTWIFRGFINRSEDDDGFLFTVLGGDDTGGIIWHPNVLAEAAEAGLRLSADNKVVDLRGGENAAEFMRPISDADMDSLPAFSQAEMEKRIVRFADLQWRADALPGDAELAAVLGHGMSAARHQTPAVAAAHGFALEWLRLPAGGATGCWHTSRAQVVIGFGGEAEVVDSALRRGGARTDSERARSNPPDPLYQGGVALPARAIYSWPAGTWRGLRNAGEGEALALLVTGGDARLTAKWDAASVARARDAGWGFDADGRLAPAGILFN